MDDETSRPSRAEQRRPRRANGPGHIVAGTVRDDSGAPVASIRVVAFNRGLRREQKLGEALSDETGQFELAYQPSRARSTSTAAIDLIVRAYAGDSSLADEPLATSSTHFNAPPSVHLNLTLVRANPSVSEFEREMSLVVPLLARQGPRGRNLPLAELAARDVEFISEATELPPDRIHLLRSAATLAAESGIEAEACYAWLRVDSTASVDDLVARPPERLLDDLERAVADAAIPSDFAPSLADAVSKLDDFRLTQLLQSATPGSPASLGDLLDSLPSAERLDGDQRLTFARLKEKHGDDDLWHAARAEGLDAAVPALKRTLALARVTSDHPALMEALHAKADSDAPESVDFLADVDPREWIELAFEHGPPPGSMLALDDYIAGLKAAVARDLPSRTLEVQLSHHLAEPGTEGTRASLEKLRDFLHAHPDFNIREHDAELFLSGDEHDDAGLRDALTSARTLSVVAGDAGEVAQLLGAGFGSAAHIVSEGPAAVVRMTQGRISTERAVGIVAAASGMTTTALALGTSYGPISVDEPTTTVGRYASAAADGATSHSTLSSLFGDLDYCSCSHCRSVLGPAAYLTDLMHSLQRSPLIPNAGSELSPSNLQAHVASFLEVAAGGTVLGALLQRRPDLADLELSCDNTNTSIPYLDLVLEVLENAVGLPLVVDPASYSGVDVPAEFAAGTIPAAVRAALAQTDITIGSELAVTEFGPLANSAASSLLHAWVIRDGSRRWLVRYLESKMLCSLRNNATGEYLPGPEIEDAAAAALALEQGTLNTELETAFGRGLPLVGQTQVQPYRPSNVSNHRLWIVQVRRGIGVRADENSGVVELVDLDEPGVVLRRYELLGRGIQQVTRAFRDGSTSPINANVADLLGLPHDEPYLQTWNANEQWWELTIESAGWVARFSQELAVASLAFQNSSIRDDLVAAPENRNLAAYRAVSADAVFPWTLPFDLWVEETRALVEALGVPRTSLVDFARPQARLDDETARLDVLGLSKAEASLVLAAPTDAAPWRFWGLAEHDNVVRDHVGGVERTGGWLEILAHLSMLLQQSGLRYQEYLDFRQCAFGGEHIGVLLPPNECRTSNISLSALSESQLAAHLERVHVFTRLWRRIGWTMRELDRTITALGGAVTAATLADLALLARLHERTGLSPLTLLGVVGDLETVPWTDHMPDEPEIARSHYDELFQPATLRSLPHFDDFRQDHLGATNAPAASQRAEFIAASLGITADDVRRWLSGPDSLSLDDELSVATLSRLHAAAAICRITDLKPASLAAVIRLTGAGRDLFRTLIAPPAPEERVRIRATEMWKFVERVDTARRTMPELADLTYLLRHETMPGTGDEAPTQIDLQITRTLTALRTAVQTGAVLSEHSVENLRGQLGRLGWYPSLIEDAIGALSHRLGAAIDIPAPANLPTIPRDLQSRFTCENPGGPTSRLQCAGSLTNTDFAELTTTALFPPATVDALRVEYESELDQRVADLARTLTMLEISPIATVEQAVAITAPVVIPEVFGTRVKVRYLTADTGTLSLTGWLSDTEASRLTESNPTLAAAIATIRAVADAAVPAPTQALLDEAERLLRHDDASERVWSVLLRLVPHLDAELVAATLSAAYGLDQGLTGTVLDRGRVGNATYRAVMSDATFLRSPRDSAINRNDWPNQFAALETFGKVASIVEELAIRPDDMAWLTSGAFSTMSLFEMPNAIANAAVDFDEWRAFADLLRLRDVLPDGRTVINRIEESLGTTTPSDEIHDAFAKAFDVDTNEVSAACGPQLLDFTPADYANPSRLIELAQLLAVMKALGADSASIQQLITPAPDQSVVQIARELFVARTNGDGLAERLRAVSDRLRVRQRDALVSYLLHRDGLADADALFDRYLIDVQMDACMLTSRVVQAISSVQLFIQRCLLNLERDGTSSGTGVSPHSINPDRRQWTQFYRVWEANRRVFLHPENWLEPSLRDDKSELFSALETELDQTELNHETASRAFGRYLEQLLDIAHLTVVSMCSEVDGSKRIVHVLARTEGQPPRYFYRRWTVTGSGAMWWSPWEQTRLAPSSEHLCLVSHHSKLYLVWLNIQKPGQDTTGKDIDWQVDVELVRRDGDAWTPISKSRTSTAHPVLPGKDERTTFWLNAGSVDDQILIQCWGGLTLPDPAAELQPVPLHTTIVTQPTSSMAYVVASGRVLQRNTATPPRYHPVPGARVQLQIGPDIQVIAHSDASGNFIVAASRPQQDFTARDISIRADSGSLTKAESLLTAANASPLLYRLTANGDIVLEPAADFAEVAATIDPERKLRMQLIRRYSWRQGEALESLPGDPSVIDTSGANTEHFASGYRERVRRPTDGLFLPPTDSHVIADSTPGRYTAVAGGGRYAYRDTAKQIYVSPNHPDPRYTVVQDGHDYVSSISVAHAGSDVEGAFRAAFEVQPVDTGIDAQKTTPASKLVREIDFERNAPYGLYNWELFFHIPLLVATQLSRAQRFEDAQRWFHLIFDPTSSDPGAETSRFWRFKPFRDVDRPIDELLEELARGSFDLKDSIEEWAENPFRPHVVARQRIRSYKATVVLRYVDNLIAWGDQHFRRDTIESLNQATQLYVLAARILGRRPGGSPKSPSTPPKSYRDIQARLDDFSNAWLPWEQWLATQGSLEASYDRPRPNDDLLLSLGTLYFCIPANDKLVEYWDLIEDRLFKIRHCRNFEGIERDLPLFAPPIDPALLVRATALGLDLSSVLMDLDAPRPAYRFTVMLQKALELCAEVKALGSALLSARDKRDAEYLMSLRSGLELDLLRHARTTREKQKAEAEADIAALRKSREATALRYLHYQRLMGNPSAVAPDEGSLVAIEPSKLRPLPTGAIGDGELEGLGLSTAEAGHASNLNVANLLSAISGSFATAASFLHLFPDITASASIGVLSASTTSGGSHLGLATSAVATGLDTAAKEFSFRANKNELIGGYQRRHDDWRFQSNLAAKELELIDRHIAISEIRKQIAEAELANHDRSVASADQTDQFLHDKYTNEQLYSWLADQVASVYFRAYELAHSVAKKAEKAYRYELGLESSSFIETGYWDSLRKGLLAGERLHLDLRRMDAAYLDQNRREYELTKHASLRSLNPEALLLLRETGRCEFEVPEVAYDLDCPGHYMRRIRSVSLTIPCVTGPYSGVNCTVTLLRNSVRRTATAGGSAYTRLDDGSRPDPRFADDLRSIDSIVTSSGQSDTGLFESNLRDERYLPFEGAGAISRWRLELPRQHRAFDYDTIADAVLHIRYTARDGGEGLRAAAQTSVRATLNALARATRGRGLAHVVSMRHDFPSEWYRITNTTTNTARLSVDLAISRSRFPFVFDDPGVKLTIKALAVYAVPAPGQPSGQFPAFVAVAPPSGTALTWKPADPIDRLAGRTADTDVLVASDDANAIWTMSVSSSEVAQLKTQTDDLLLVLRYEFA